MMFVAMALIGCQNKEEGNNDIQEVETITTIDNTQEEIQEDIQNGTIVIDDDGAYVFSDEYYADMILEGVESGYYEEEFREIAAIDMLISHHLNGMIRLSKYRFYHPAYGYFNIDVTLYEQMDWCNEDERIELCIYSAIEKKLGY